MAEQHVIATADWMIGGLRDESELYVALLDDDYTYQADHVTFDDVAAYEIDALGYSPGGQQITGIGVESTPDGYAITGDDVTWHAQDQPIGAAHAMVYDAGCVNELLTWIEFAVPVQTGVWSELAIEWDDGVILRAEIDIDARDVSDATADQPADDSPQCQCDACGHHARCEPRTPCPNCNRGVMYTH